jgi:hypothetical protein
MDKEVRENRGMFSASFREATSLLKVLNYIAQDGLESSATKATLYFQCAQNGDTSIEKAGHISAELDNVSPLHTQERGQQRV